MHVRKPADYENCNDENDNPALVWNEEKCACERIDEADEYQAMFESCADSQNGLDGTERSYCYMNNGLKNSGYQSCGGFIETMGSLEEDASTETETETESDSDAVNSCMTSFGVPETLANRIALVNVLLSVIMWFGNSNLDNGMCASGVWMTAASVAGIANELISYFFMENALRDLQLDFYEEMLCDTSVGRGNNALSSDNETDVSEGCVQDNPYDAQVSAFNFLVDERRVCQDVYKKRSGDIGLRWVST